MRHKTLGTECGECGCTLIGHWTWARIPHDERPQLRADGYNRAAKRDTCCTCYVRGRYVPKTSGRSTVPRVVVLESWQWLHEQGELSRHDSRAKRIEQAAPRLGMKPKALERALDRAKAAA